MNKMKIFGNKNNLGNKAVNINKLYKNNFLIPKTFIIEKTKIKECNYSFLKNNNLYIIRPVFENEDNIIFSNAGYYKSIYPVKKYEIINILKNKSYLDFFNGNKVNFKSIIIQKYIKTNIYGVFFTRDPNNILKKGFYELGQNNDEVTSGNTKNKNLNLNYFQKKELELIGNKLEIIFNYPQDIEFCIKNKKIFILQTRNITTGNNSIYNFSEIKNINGIYQTLDFDELGEKQDFFSYKVLKRLFNILYIDSRIYFKKSLFPYFYFKNFNKIKNNNLKLFIKNYKNYLIYKLMFSILKILSFQKIDKKILKDFYKYYNYSFLLEQKSNINLDFDIKNINFISKKFIKLEKQKNLAFKYLEEYKEDYKNNNLENFISDKYLDIQNKLIIKNGTIINIFKQEKNNYKWIYKGKINGKITNLSNFKYKKNLNQILILNDLDYNLYDKLDYINGLIIKNGNLLSHNSIVCREYKIPSIIKYKDFEKLKVGDNISII